jgi:hypothetical protein
MDLVVINQGNITMSIFIGYGNGSFSAAITFESDDCKTMAIGDFDGDGRLDIADVHSDIIRILLNMC